MIQLRVNHLQLHRFYCKFSLGSNLTPELVFTHLIEEIGEISRQLVNKNLAMRKYDKDNLKREIAQAIFRSICSFRIAQHGFIKRT